MYARCSVVCKVARFGGEVVNRGTASLAWRTSNVGEAPHKSKCVANWVCWEKCSSSLDAIMTSSRAPSAWLLTEIPSVHCAPSSAKSFSGLANCGGRVGVGFGSGG